MEVYFKFKLDLVSSNFENIQINKINDDKTYSIPTHVSVVDEFTQLCKISI